MASIDYDGRTSHDDEDDDEFPLEADIVRSLADAITEADHENLAGCRITTFVEGDLLTSNAGLVIHHPSGRDFQVTVVRSR